MFWKFYVPFIAWMAFSSVGAAETKGQDFDIVTSDGEKLAATYYSPGKPGPGILLLHQCNMDRKCWKDLAPALAQRGIHALAFDYRGFGESSRKGGRENLVSDIDTALAKLLSLPGVDPSALAAGGASCGVDNAVKLAKRSNRIQALVLLSGPTSTDGLAYLKQHPEIAIFGAASSEEDLAVKSIRTVVATSKHPLSTMRELHNAGHGTPMFGAEPPLLPATADWLKKVFDHDPIDSKMAIDLQTTQPKAH